jgi:plasmid stabilization system protein ParE
MLELRILDEAAREVEAAATYLEERRTGFGSRFLEAYERKLAQIGRFWESGPVLRGAPAGYDLRAFWLRRFGYRIIVGRIGGVPTIIAVMHHSRKPEYWLDRLQ